MIAGRRSARRRQGGSAARRAALANAAYEAPPIDPVLDEALLDFIARREREIPA